MELGTSQRGSTICHGPNIWISGTECISMLPGVNQTVISCYHESLLLSFISVKVLDRIKLKTLAWCISEAVRSKSQSKCFVPP